MATSKGFDYERLIDAFNAYGQALCAYEDACRYANQRIVKGQEIGRLQLIQNHIMETVSYTHLDVYKRQVLSARQEEYCN